MPGSTGDDAERVTQAQRRARSRQALLESAARQISRNGYHNLALAQVAKEAGYTRGALYHQFKDKQELVLAVSDWVLATWQDEVGQYVDAEPDPLAALLVLARGHAVYCRRDIARVAIAIRLELAGQDHPIGNAVERGYELLVTRCARLIRAGRKAGTIPAGPPARTVALAFVGALEGTVTQLAGYPRHDEQLTARAVTGVLGLDPSTTAKKTTAPG